MTFSAKSRWATPGRNTNKFNINVPVKSQTERKPIKHSKSKLSDKNQQTLLKLTGGGFVKLS